MWVALWLGAGIAVLVAAAFVIGRSGPDRLAQLKKNAERVTTSAETEVQKMKKAM